MKMTVASAIAVLFTATSAFSQFPPPPPPPPPIIQPIQPGFQPGFELPPGEFQPGELETVPDFRNWLQSRLANGKTEPGDLDQQKQETLQQLLKQLKDQHNIGPDQIKDIIKNNKKFQDPEFLKKVEALTKSKDFPNNIQNLLKKQNDLQPPKIDNPDQLKQQLDQVLKQQPKDVKNPVDPDVSLPTPEEKPKTGREKMMKWLQEQMKDSPQSQQMIEDLFNELGKSSDFDILKELPELQNGAWKDLLQSGESTAEDIIKDIDGGEGFFSKWKFNFRWGSGGGGGGGGWNIGGGGGGGGSVGAPEGSTLTNVILPIFGLIGVAFIAYLLHRRWREQTRQAELLQASLVFPVDYFNIRTREDLVRVFDDYCVKTLGAESLHWNHHVLLSHLDQKTLLKEELALLGRLYEKARYAPLNEEMTASELHVAEECMHQLSRGASI
ncbi:MAG: hypothetical protein R3B84_13685 [Zavarzinella sp.]